MDQTPDQIKKIKQAQRTLWVGIFLIVLVGTLIAVYFIFVNPVGEAEDVINTNVPVVAVDTSNWQIYTSDTSGYSIKYPDNYLVKTETEGYVVFDPISIDSPSITYLHISVTVEDNDFHTYRLGVLTNTAVDNDSLINEEDVVIDGLDGKKITLKNALGETVIHYIVSYLGKVYDISAGDSIGADVLSNFLSNFQITQLDDGIDISDTNEFSGKQCVGNNDCGAYPCIEGTCLVKECTSDSECLKGTCGQYVTPVPGYCTTIDVL